MDSFSKVLRFLPDLSRDELCFVINRARALGGIAPSTERWRKHKERVGANTVSAFVQTLLDKEVVSTSVSSNGVQVPETTRNTRQENRELREQAAEVLRFLNEKASRNYRETDTNLGFISARISSGISVQDCKSIIAKKTREWKDKPEMVQYLRPATLFNKVKCEQYVGELARDTS